MVKTTSPNAAPQDRVLIFDTTLRDGEQSPGATMSHTEKLEIAEMLDDMGVDIIEAGFPIASDGDFKAVSDIAKLAKSSVICGLSRAVIGDIDRCWQAVKHAKAPRIHTFIGTSPQHRAIPNLNTEQLIEKIQTSVTHARNLCDNVQWSPMDATRTERDYLARCVEVAIRAGATTINITDTVGYTAPNESAEIIRFLIDTVPDADTVVFATDAAEDEARARRALVRRSDGTCGLSPALGSGGGCSPWRRHHRSVSRLQRRPARDLANRPSREQRRGARACSRWQ